MTVFIRLMAKKDKASSLQTSCHGFREGQESPEVFEVAVSSFKSVPGAPFAYWVGDDVRKIFSKISPFESSGRSVQHGASTKDDFRFIRIWWEVEVNGNYWTYFAKGGAYSRFYSDMYLAVNWRDDARELEAALLHKYPYLGESANWVIHRECDYLRPGLTWPKRTTSDLSFRIMPRGCVFSDKGSAAFASTNKPLEILSLCAIANSRSFGVLVSLQLAAADAAARSYEVGVIQKTPVPELTRDMEARLAKLARRHWSLMRTLDSTAEISHVFCLPSALRTRVGDYDPTSAEVELSKIQAEIDNLAFNLYGFVEADRAAALGSVGTVDDNAGGGAEDRSESEDDKRAEVIEQTDDLLSWTVGVAFGRFDWRLATGEREAPIESDPFDPLPAKSPGMLPDGVEPFHHHPGVLVDDPGHADDLPRLMESILERVETPAPGNLRRWLQRGFFKQHLKQYSKSRRKAPIYWPLSTSSGRYTLWIYYPELDDQTLYMAVNDFIEPKLKLVDDVLNTLRSKTGRTTAEEREFEKQQDLHQELIDLRDTILEIAPNYKPNHDDGVQITAAPLWPLFRHKPWQKVLKQTWEKLEAGDYDWAHLAYSYWPDRVREKCKTDKSLAIAHGLEELYEEPSA